ncbi:MAG: hypothetical protein JNL92_14610 [Opitutaceae bacterium]|nr:hypothetical protein [Opitutaceae bacterium]
MTVPSKDPAEILEIWAAMEESIRRYTAERRGRIGDFCERHHGWRGMWRIHSESVKEDFVTNPLNLLWALPYALLRSAVEWIRRLGWLAPSEWFKSVPAKFKTGSQKRIEWLLITEVLELPYGHGSWQASREGLAEEFLRHPKLSGLRGQPEWESLLHTPPELWQNELRADAAERSAAADLASGGATLAAGWFLFGRAALSVFGMGEQYARQSVREEAVRKFSLGPIHFGPKVDQKLGSLYYDLFPTHPTQAQIWIGTAVIMLGVAVLSLLLHALLDPLYQSLGLHEVRLQRFLDRLEARLLEHVRANLSPRMLANRST